jgi:apolipoprotein N-acyltransferase
VGTKREKIASVVMVLVGGLLVAFSMGRWLAPLAGWVGPVLIIRYARDHKVWRGYAVVLAAYIMAIFIAFFSIWWGGLPRVMAPFLVVGIGFLWSLPYLADRLISPRIGGFWGTFVFPWRRRLWNL